MVLPTLKTGNELYEKKANDQTPTAQAEEVEHEEDAGPTIYCMAMPD